jgi:hypothetical protein
MVVLPLPLLVTMVLIPGGASPELYCLKLLLAAISRGATPAHTLLELL